MNHTIILKCIIEYHLTLDPHIMTPILRNKNTYFFIIVFHA